MVEGDPVTMADFRQACIDRIDHAKQSGEEGFVARRTYERFDTPAGLEIIRVGGMLAVECDYSELGHDAQFRRVRVEFPDGEPDPQVIETNDRRDRTLPRTRHDEVAAELIKYVTLEV